MDVFIGFGIVFLVAIMLLLEIYLNKSKILMDRRNKMIIKITKCSEDHYWYKNKVGNYFKVINEGDVAYSVENIGNTDNGQAAVMVGDFEIVNNPYCYHVSYHWKNKIDEGFASDVVYVDFKLDSPPNLRGMKEHLEKERRYSNIVILNFIRLKDVSEQ